MVGNEGSDDALLTEASVGIHATSSPVSAEVSRPLDHGYEVKEGRAEKMVKQSR